MDRRGMKGAQIAHSGRIGETPKGWIAPSQSRKGSYLVYKEGEETKCNCPDCEFTGMKCKHQWTVEYFTKEIRDEEGNVTITKEVKVTYTQNWKACKIPDENEKILEEVCTTLGMKKSEISRIALMEYLKSLSIISQKVKESDTNR